MRIVLAAALIGAGLAIYTASRLSVDTDNQNLLSPKLPWRQAEGELDRLFPQLSNSLVFVIDGATPELADDAQRSLVQRLRSRPDFFAEVFAAETDPYFRRNGLLYLDLPALQALVDDLTRAQPFLGALNQDPSLHGLFTLLGRALEAPPGQDFDLAPALGKIAQGVGAVADGRFFQLSWQELMGGMPLAPNARRRFIEVSAHLDYSRLLPAAGPVNAARGFIRELHLDAGRGVRVRLTGSVAMEHEELLTAFQGMGLALAAAMLMVAGLLYLALRSVRLVMAAVLTLIYGLLATAAFAAAVVGHLNLISVAFSVLYVGLGLDYALYLCMQYRERLGQGISHEEALPHAAGDVGGFMLVCAATTSLGFFAFIPTSFTGIAELGVISGAGMFISLLLSLTLLPALISLMPPDAARIRLQPAGGGRLESLLRWPYTYARQIWAAAIVAAVISLMLAPRARFDYDPLNLRDPSSESVATFRDLLRDPSIPTLTLSALTQDPAAAARLAQRLSGLPLVARVMSLQDFIPQEQEQKLAIIGDLSFALGPQLASVPIDAEAVAHPADMQALTQLRAALPAYLQHAAGTQASAARALLQQLERFDALWRQRDSAGKAQLLAGLRAALIGAVPAHLNDLKTALQAAPVGLQDLPPQLLQRWLSADGHYRVEIWPREILDTPRAMERFVDQVRAAVPSAVGPPVVQLEAGRAVVQAFRQAFLYSFIAITLLLLILLRSVVDTLLVLIPLALAGLLTVAGSVIFNIPFNFANVIALPLILGVGVDYGVYLVQRGRAAASANINLLQTSTARAVLFGALITMANFGNLALAKHPGTVSMGLLLTVGLGTTLLCALVLLPSLLARRHGAPI